MFLSREQQDAQEFLVMCLDRVSHRCPAQSHDIILTSYTTARHSLMTPFSLATRLMVSLRVSFRWRQS